MCLYPKLIKNRRYIANKKNGGNVPPIPDERVKYVPIGCQECKECRKQKARGWQLRLLEEVKRNRNGKFITLTFSNEQLTKILEQIQEYNTYNELPALEGYDLDNQIATFAMRYFLERWRKKYKKSLRHWMVTELGHQGTENIHLHGIVWTNEPLKEIENIWQYGFVWKGKEINDHGKKIIINYVTERTVGYITKYVSKPDLDHYGYKSKVLTSPGIGRQYKDSHNARANTYQERKTVETYTTPTGHKIAMPVYWRNHLYTEKQREQLWLYRLDKQERWICGERVSIKNGEEHYWRLLSWHQRKNKELGYGDDTVNWSRKEYEKQRRNLKLLERVKATKYSCDCTTTATGSRVKSQQKTTDVPPGPSAPWHSQDDR